MKLARLAFIVVAIAMFLAAPMISLAESADVPTAEAPGAAVEAPKADAPAAAPAEAPKADAPAEAPAEAPNADAPAAAPAETPAETPAK